jgi:hypothetical protein
MQRLAVTGQRIPTVEHPPLARDREAGGRGQVSMVLNAVTPDCKGKSRYGSKLCLPW